jgi:glutaredoxin
MKRLKKILLLVLALILVMPLGVRAEEEVTTIGAELPKVKVYIFEAGGCPWCERQKEYLKGLESYGKKFVIVTKELYVDHISWQEGKDYELGKKVAEAFNEAGFADASYNGTPLVIISDLYAASAYSESLEKYIDKAYELKDKDIVSCLAEKDDCPIGTTE